MTTLRQAAEQALEALEQYTGVVSSTNDPNAWITVVDSGKPARDAITSLQEALAQREWVGLTDEEVLSEAKRFALGLAFPFNGITTPEMFARSIEAKLKEKNT